MDKNFCLKKREIFFLTLNLIFLKSCINVPKQVLAVGGSAAVWACAAGCLLCVLFAAFLLLAYSKTECGDIFELVQKKLSPVWAFCIKLFIALYLACSAGRALFETVRFSSLSAFEGAPFVFAAVIYSAACFYAAKCGGTAITKASEVVVPVAVLTAFFAIISSAGQWNVTNLYPLGGYGTKNTFCATVSGFFYCFDFVFVLFLNPFAGSEKALKNSFFAAVICGVMINFLTLAAAGLSFSCETAKRLEYPVYSLIKTVSFGRIMQRIDAVYFFAVSLSSMAYISFEVFLSGLAFEKAFGFSKNNVICSAVSLIVLLSAVLSDKRGACFFKQYETVFDIILCAVIFLIPAVCYKRGKRRRSK